MDSSNADVTNEAQKPEIGRGSNQGGMRERNERVVLTLLRRSPGLAKAEIARRTGLSAQTVARLIRSLEADGLILRGEPSKGRIGQPSVPLSLNPEGALFLGMKVGRRSVEMIVVNFLGTIIDHEKKIYDYPDFDEILTFAHTSFDALCDRLPSHLRNRVAGLGIAMPFFLWNWADSIGVDANLMMDWKHRDLQAETEARLGLPVFLQNDATSACSAEMVFGQNALPENTLCFYVAFFIGGGLVLRNALYAGATGNAAGFGPLAVNDLKGNSRPLIEIASLSKLENMLSARGLDPRQIWESTDNWDIPDDILSPWILECAHALAQAVRSAQTILDLDLVLVDGWMPKSLAKSLANEVAVQLSKLDMTGMHRPNILHGTLGPSARALGAASLPLSKRFLLQS